MREIKFRAWNRRTQRMINLHNAGPYYQYSLYCHNNGVGLSGFDGCSESIESFEKEDIEIMQRTGLKDKNGNEIYEGDIVRYKFIYGFGAEDSLEDGREGEFSKHIGEVKFDKGCFYPIESASYPDDGYYGWRQFDFEVIGNKRENPDLLPPQ